MTFKSTPEDFLNLVDMNPNDAVIESLKIDGLSQPPTVTGTVIDITTSHIQTDPFGYDGSLYYNDRATYDGVYTF